jgi:hypothetical protein
VNEFQQRIGVGEVHYGLARTGPTRKRKVIAEEGPNKGKVAAIQTDHGNGRVDAQVFPAHVKKTISFKES